jgi:phosphatidylglycerophosphatase A
LGSVLAWAGAANPVQGLVNTFQKKATLFLVSGAGVGYFPLAPGTTGTLVAIPLSLGLNRLAAISFPIAFLILIGFIYCAIWLSSKGAEILGQKDPAIIVIDEIAGFLVASFLTPFGRWPLVLAFLLFRFFDIVKVFPASNLERLPGGNGIVLDDVMAGLYTFIILRLMFAWNLL